MSYKKSPTGYWRVGQGCNDDETVHMSAIFGFVSLNGQPATVDLLERMRNRLAHRAPDGSSLFFQGPVGLGQGMLCTTPESRDETLPLVHPQRSIVLTADARIDNRDDLLRQFGLPATTTDGTLILAAHEKWEDESPAHLLGDFAFVVWDSFRRRLFAARDPSGTRPFYYYYRPGSLFAFATEIKALFCFPEIPRKLNERRIADYLADIAHLDSSATAFEEIFRLPAAHRLTVDASGITLSRYVSFDPSNEIRLPSDAAYAEAFLEIFTEAVRCRLRSNTPVGASLSGGMDSSAVVCVARKLLAEASAPPLHTFTQLFDNVPESDERQFSEAVCAQGAVVHHRIYPEKVDPLADLLETSERQDDLSAYWMPSLTTMICREAAGAGVRVLLDGVDGDTTVSHGTAYLDELFRTGRWRRLADEIGDLAKTMGTSRWRMWVDLIIKPAAPLALHRAWARLRGHYPTYWDVMPFIRPDFQRRFDLSKRMYAFQSGAGVRRLARSARTAHMSDMDSELFPLSFEGQDPSEAVFSVEFRHPFRDWRLMEFCLALPPTQKFRRGLTRVVMRNAMASFWPEAVRQRTRKVDFNPVLAWLWEKYTRPQMGQFLSEASKHLEPYVDVTALRRYHDTTDPRIFYARQGWLFWRVIILAIWLQREAAAATYTCHSAMAHPRR